MSPPIPRNSQTTADGIGRRSGLLAFTATLVLQSGLILWAGYIDTDRTPPEEAPIRTAIRFAVAADRPQAVSETPVEPVGETPRSLPDPPEAPAEPPPEKAPEPVVEEVLPKPVEPKPLVETPQPAPEPPKPKPVAPESAKRIPKEAPKEIVPQKPVEAKPTPPPEPNPELIRRKRPAMPDAAPATDKVVSRIAPSAEPAAKERVPRPVDRAGVSMSAPAASTAGSEAKTADSLLAALASMIERHKKYPKAAQRARLEGDVRVKVLVDSGGRLQSYNLIESSGHGILDKATLAIFKRINGRRIASNEMERALEIVVPVRYLPR